METILEQASIRDVAIDGDEPDAPGLLRRVLVQVAWGLQRRTETRGHAVFERLCHGQRTRRKQAVVALARKLLVWSWALLRDGSVWDNSRGVRGARGVRPATG